MSQLLFAIDLFVVVMLTIGFDFFWFIDYCKKTKMNKYREYSFFLLILTVINDCLVDHVCGKFNT